MREKIKPEKIIYSAFYEDSFQKLNKRSGPSIEYITFEIETQLVHLI